MISIHDLLNTFVYTHLDREIDRYIKSFNFELTIKMFGGRANKKEEDRNIG